MNIRLLNLGFVRKPDGTYLHIEAGYKVEVLLGDKYNILDIYSGKVTTDVDYNYVEYVVFTGMEKSYDNR